MLHYLLLLIMFPLYPFTIMLDPAGDGRDAGRIIGDSFERGITFQYAEALKKSLEEAYPSARVLLSRYPGEELELFHQANFANRAQVDLFIRIQFYQERGVRSHCYCYYYCANPITDEWPMKHDSCTFLPLDQAHRLSLTKTKVWAQTLIESLQEYLPLHYVHCPVGMPCKPLVGLTMPALCIELSIKEPEDWRMLVSPLTDSFEYLIR